VENIIENKEAVLEQAIKDVAISSGKINKTEIYDFQLGTVESYSGEGVVELDGNRYKVIGHSLLTSEGKIVKRGWIQVYKMREWQE